MPVLACESVTEMRARSWGVSPCAARATTVPRTA
jgi:hypothetical protein